MTTSTFNGSSLDPVPHAPVLVAANVLNPEVMVRGFRVATLQSYAPGARIA